jgi:F0F1-type ATP synthase assembly protein I
MIATQRTQQNKYRTLHGVMMLSAWGVAMVVASFLFLWAGFQLDKWLGTAPNFMFGLFFLAIFLCIMRLYQEAREQMGKL